MHMPMAGVSENMAVVECNELAVRHTRQEEETLLVQERDGKLMPE
jgi:hypothetical protein